MPLHRLATAAVLASTALTAALTAGPAQAASRATVKVDSSRFGPILVDGRGRTLYLFTRDPRGASRCFGACARAWPPLLTDRAPRAGRGARRSLLGSIRRGSRRHVTYRGRPLYYYVGDNAPGVIRCQAVPEFGGTWYVVKPSGSAVR